MKKYNLVYREGKPMLKEVNPHAYDKAPEFGSTSYSRFDSKAERELIPLLCIGTVKESYNRDEFDIVEAYENDGFITFDLHRPFYARNMGLKIIDAALPIN